MRMPSKPDSDGGSAAEVLIQYVDATYASPPHRAKRAADVNEAQQSAAKWARWVGETLRRNIQDELVDQESMAPRDEVRIAALKAAKDAIKGW